MKITGLVYFDYIREQTSIVRFMNQGVLLLYVMILTIYTCLMIKTDEDPTDAC